MGVKKPFEKPNDKIVDVEELIDRGARVKADNKVKNNPKWTHLNLRIPTTLLDGVDEAMNERVGISRTGWILEAIQEKLRRE